PTILEDIMAAFYDGKYDLLLSTTIIESGLDIPTANTLIVHRSDMFGLSQLYQLRGRVGRSKTRAYALFTLPANKRITAQAERRLKVIQSLDTLGAGFQLASHDPDIRGPGPLPQEVQHLLRIVAIKALCRRANVEKVDTGPKGAVLAFRNNEFANPDGLVAYIRDQSPAARVRPDMKVVFFDDWERPEQRLR